MNNVLLDPLPEEWKGIRINTDYRIGLQLCLIQNDLELTDYEKSIVITQLLFPDGFSREAKDLASCLDWVRP